MGCAQVGVTVLLGLFLLLPGIIFAIWADSYNRRVCPKCEARTLVPADSPTAQRIIKDRHTHPGK